MTLSEPIPKDLREQMMKRVETASEEDLVLVNQLFLLAQKDRLWKEIQQDAAAEKDAGKLDNIPDLIRQYRANNKAA